MSNSAPKVLVVGPAWIGDMVMVQSLFKFIKERNDDAVIDVIAPAWTEALLSRMPEVHQAISMPIGHGKLGLGIRWQLGKSLRPERYDRAIVLPRSLKSAITPFAARAKRRTGFLGELRYGLLNDIRSMDKNTLPRTVDRFVYLGLEAGEKLPDTIPNPELISDKENAAEAKERLGIGKENRPVLGLLPGAEYGPAKQWPAEHFASVADSMAQRGWEIWIFGSGKDSAIAREIQENCETACADLTGKTGLLEAIDLISITSAVVTNDSGFMHVAAALKVPLVAVYGSSDPLHTPPLSDIARIERLDLDCSPCFKRECPYGHYRCLNDLGPERIIKSIDSLQNI